MVTLHGEEVKAGDPVWHVFKGWGEVAGIDDECTLYPILVRWEDGEEWYTEDGKHYFDAKTPTLFWQPVEFGIPKKPKPKEKVWQELFFDSQRVAFEAFLVTQMPAFPPKVLFERRENGEYVSLVAHYSWKAWQTASASQASDDRVRELEAKYSELIMAVARKYPNETCHETILRYIRQAESGNDNCEAKKEANK